MATMARHAKIIIIINLNQKFGEIAVSPIRYGSHAQAAFKEYAVTKSRLIFVGSLDVNLERMKGKHESNEGETIKIKDLIRVR